MATVNPASNVPQMNIPQESKIKSLCDKIDAFANKVDLKVQHDKNNYFETAVVKNNITTRAFKNTGTFGAAYLWKMLKNNPDMSSPEKTAAAVGLFFSGLATAVFSIATLLMGPLMLGMMGATIAEHFVSDSDIERELTKRSAKKAGLEIDEALQATPQDTSKEDLEKLSNSLKEFQKKMKDCGVRETSKTYLAIGMKIDAIDKKLKA